MSSLPLDVFVKRKKIENENKNKTGFLDKRRFRTRMGIEESQEKTIMSEIESYGVDDTERVFRIVKKIPHYQVLNITLLLIVYFYFSDKNFDFFIVSQNFDQDFEKVIDDIYEKGFFGGRKFNSLELYKFRQDFIMYMLLINNMETTEVVDDYPDLVDIGEEITGFYETPFEAEGD